MDDRRHHLTNGLSPCTRGSEGRQGYARRAEGTHPRHGAEFKRVQGQRATRRLACPVCGRQGLRIFKRGGVIDVAQQFSFLLEPRARRSARGLFCAGLAYRLPTALSEGSGNLAYVIDFVVPRGGRTHL